MLSCLKTLLTNVPAQSTPQTYRSRAGVRRQSSVGPLHDTSPLTGGGGAGEPAVSTPAHSTTLPVSSLSTNPSSYYTNATPSPPAAPAPQHVSCDDILASPAPPTTARPPSCRSAPHSAINLHQAGRPAALPFSNERTHNAATQVSDIDRVIDEEQPRLSTHTRSGSLQDSISPQYQNVGSAASAASVATVLTRLDELSKRVATLETGLTTDVRRILQLLQQRDGSTHQNVPQVHTPSAVLAKTSLSVPPANDVSVFIIL